MATEPKVFRRVEPCVDAILAAVGKEIHLGLPLGLGKANRLANALYQRALEDKSVSLHIVTALSLTLPHGSQPLERRFLEPFVERVWAGVPELDYARDLQRGALPENVKVSEFFFKAGSNLGNATQQQNYICTNYTHAVRDLLAQGVNVVAQMVAPDPGGSDQVSFSCNPDLSLDLIPLLREGSAGDVVVVGEVNPSLPFMEGKAAVPAALFDLLLEGPAFNYSLFPAPAMAIEPAEHMIGLFASALLRDGGTLQVGIGSLGSAVIYSTILRHQRNDTYRELLERLDVATRFPVALEVGGSGTFDVGLYGCSEMLVDGFVELYRAGILKREVFDDPALQRLINEGLVDTRPSLDMLDQLVEAELIQGTLRARDIKWLQRYGILADGVELKGGRLVIGDESAKPELTDPEARKLIGEKFLGASLRGGVVAHGGFFLGPQSFYQALRDMPPESRQKFSMTSVKYINDLYDHPFGSQTLKAAQRTESRFINSAMMQTLNGAAVSDGLEDGRVISGVGGQYNFVAMAHELPGARSVLTLRSTRQSAGKTVSNIVFNYGHITIPRHLRDIVVTEYGIADLRGKSDQAVYKALIQIADSRFQQGLLRQAKKAGKISSSWAIPNAYCNNRPEEIVALVEHYRKQHDIFPAFPFDCAFTPEELRLAEALQALKAATSSPMAKLQTLIAALKVEDVPAHWQALLSRMGLERVEGWRQKLDRKLLLQGLRLTEPDAGPGNTL
ncbi:acetyl-CoA hydrolase/transferase C-terminal domain-containing protein [Hydrocarboniclastica marina]|uniref:Acetyl-CoA hydrolase n=1 Tax=Hydrocarboniclastica marina TaxID=2259620 RepID=A0A4P7XEE3_9ALTE|nr:acetyl-CoA hydrolase/transferase C-terminal domain-containing protein [Hydrocarboniclastica marina]QCF25258.1 acetyl-CoA hydrolase [Hydrocarboniclastica marina]